MRKLTVLGIVALMCIIAACTKKAGEGTQTAGGELALITDLGTIDDKSFNQGAWEGLVEYAKDKNISHKYYQPAEQSDHAYLGGIDLAVKGGAKVVVTPGFLFEVPVYIAQDRYPDVTFILIDGSPHNGEYTDFKVGPKTVGVSYAEEQAGYLAGYAAVKDGMRKLGFMGGMAVPAVVRFGYGFVQGANDAGVELGLDKGAITVKYHYTGAFAASPEAQALAASWYNDGEEVIFACGGAVGNSIMAAAEQAGKKVIGVDVDQSGESPSVMTSAVKELKLSVFELIKDFYEGGFPGGLDVIYSAENDGIGLVLDNAKFTNFTKDDYDAIYAKLKSGQVKIMRDVDGRGDPVTISDINTTAVSVIDIK
jgi:basic membrane protein A